MKILTKKNGIALVAVLTVLLVLTLLLPIMFTMTENATESSVRSETEHKASYFARTSVEMAVMAFEEFYDAYDSAHSQYLEQTGNGQSVSKPEVCTKYEEFISNGTMKASRVYIYTKDSYAGKKPPSVAEDSSMAGYNEWQNYENNAIAYEAVSRTAAAPAKAGYTLLGYADCDISYEEIAEYYKVNTDGSMELLVPQKDASGGVAKTPEQQYNDLMANYSPGQPTWHKVERKQVKFRSVTTLGEKQYNGFDRTCTVVLPTEPTENNWLAPTKIKNNQIFADTSKATGMAELSYDSSFTGNNSGGGSEGAINQVLFSFSASGNMIISSKGLKSTAEYNVKDLSLGVEPVTETKNPENDPHFNCLATNNMKKWATGVQKDNFIMFSATNGIQVEMPVNLLINPCRTMRIGDGISANQTLYKLLVFQAPNITFQNSVNSMVSLWRRSGLGEILADQLLGDGYDARRVTSIILSAPEHTPYSYVNEGRNNQVVKAGKVCFMEDAYIWIIPVTERGSNYKTQTVYYKNTDIQLYKFAEAGDVYYFNSEVGTQDGKNSTGFSMSAYFMDVLYPDVVEDDFGWQFWKTLRAKAFGFAQKNFVPIEYVREDFSKIGNIYTDEGVETEQVDDIFVVWDS